MKVLSGLIIGAIFGFMLHRGGLVRYSRIIGALLLFFILRHVMKKTPQGTLLIG